MENTIKSKINALNKVLANGQHEVRIITEKVENPFLKRGFYEEFGFTTDDAVKTSEFTAIAGGGVDFVSLYNANMVTPLEREGKRKMNLSEVEVVPGVLKTNEKTGNTNLVCYAIKGKDKASVSWTLPGKDWFDAGDKKYASFWKSAPKKAPVKGDNLKIMKVGLQNIKSIFVDGKKVW